MTIRIFYLLNLLVFLVVPFLYSRKEIPAMTQFYLRMAFFYKFRKCYRLVLLGMLMMLHFYHLTIFQCHYDVLVSSLMCLPFLSRKYAERLWDFLQDKQTLLSVAVIAIAFLFVPHCMMIGVVLGTFIFSAVFYPSRKVRYMVSMPDSRQIILNNPKGIATYYFEWNDFIIIRWHDWIFLFIMDILLYLIEKTTNKKK